MVHKLDKKTSFTRKRATAFASIVALVVGTVVPVSSVQAAQLEDRQLTLESSAASATTGHNYSFTIATSDSVAEIQFEYCANNPFPGQSCTAPSGLDVSNVTLDAQSHGGTNDFTIDGTNTTTNEIVIERTAESISSGTTVTFDFGNAVNPDSPNSEFFVRLYTYSDDGVTKVDDGGLAFSTAETVDVTARVEENLLFCIHATGASCGTPGDTSLDLGVLSTSSERTAQHQSVVATNALHGFTIQYAGTTLTHSNGTDTINAIGATGTDSSPGNEQFGMNISVNSGSGVTLDGDYSGTDCNASTCYAFVDGATVQDGGDSTTTNTIASSTDPVGNNLFDITYLGNVNSTTPTGVYSTTVTYVATATF